MINVNAFANRLACISGYAGHCIALGSSNFYINSTAQSQIDVIINTDRCPRQKELGSFLDQLAHPLVEKGQYHLWEVDKKASVE